VAQTFPSAVGTELGLTPCHEFQAHPALGMSFPPSPVSIAPLADPSNREARVPAHVERILTISSRPLASVDDKVEASPRAIENCAPAASGAAYGRPGPVQFVAAFRKSTCQRSLHTTVP